MVKGRPENRRLSGMIAKGLVGGVLCTQMPAFALLGISQSKAPQRSEIIPPSNEVSQLNPNPSIFSEPPFNRIPRTQPVSPQLPTDPTSPLPSSTSPIVPPDTYMTPVNGQVSIRFVNLTGSAIDYQVIDTTEYRTLAGRSEMILKGLPVPTTLTFRRQDKGFLLVTLTENQPEVGTLTMTVRETPDFTADRTSIYIDLAGGVFLN